MFSKCSIKFSSNLLFVELSMFKNCSSNIVSKSPEQYATNSIIDTQAVNIHPMNTRQATDTKNCGSISCLPATTNMTPLMVWIAIIMQWKLNIWIRSDIKKPPIAGKIEKMMNSQSWKIMKCNALMFQVVSPIKNASVPKPMNISISMIMK